MSNDHTDSGEIRVIDRTDYGQAPRVTPEAIEAFIASEHYFTAGQGARAALLDEAIATGDTQKLLERFAQGSTIVPGPLYLLTFCVMILKNGFTVHGVSACASPSNFSKEIGERVARGDAVNKIWPLLGFQLRDHLHKAATIGDSDLDEAMTRLIAHGLGNAEALRKHDTDVILAKLEEERVEITGKTDFELQLEK